MRKSDKDMRPLEKKLKKLGYTIGARGSHNGLYENGKLIAALPVHVGDWRAMRNLVSDLRHKGVPL